MRSMISADFASPARLHRGERRQFATGGEAHDADAVRLEIPFRRATAHHADGATGIGHRVILNRVSGAHLASETVFQDKRRDAMIAQPFRQRVAFMAETQLGMSSTGRDDHRDAVASLVGLKGVMEGL